VSTSLTGIEQRYKIDKDITDSITSFQATMDAHMRRDSMTMKEGGDRWLDCGTRCQHLLGEGNAPGYGVCYWACVIRGGSDYSET
jgi:hypothetical protein